jgi:hypothetical protein
MATRFPLSLFSSASSLLVFRDLLWGAKVKGEIWK